MRNLQDAIVVITGAGSGIGQALAVNLASQGAKLALADVNTSGLEETRKLAGAAPVRTYVVNVADKNAVRDFARSVESDFGGASLLVNNAGVALFGTFAELSLEEMEWLININFWGVVYGCKFFVPLLERQPEAHIVNVSSVFGLIGPAGHTAYCSSKFAVRGFSECLREELRATNVKVSCVHPAGVATRIADDARIGVATKSVDLQRDRERFSSALTIPPAEAAQVIVQGILANKNRILIGADAYRIDFLQRLFPARATEMLSNWIQRRIEKDSAKLAVEVKP